MSCEHATTLHGYLDGELDAARSAEFERHLENCAECLTDRSKQNFPPAPVLVSSRVLEMLNSRAAPTTKAPL